MTPISGNFPQTPWFDPAGNISWEWLRFLQGIQTITNDLAEYLLTFQALEGDNQQGALLAQQIADLQTQIALVGDSKTQQQDFTQAIKDLQTEIAVINDQTAALAALATTVNDLQTYLASVIEPNYGPINQKIYDLEILGAMQ